MGFGRSLVLLAFLIGGLAMTGYGWTMLQNEQADIKQAVEVEGTVKSTDVEAIETDDTVSFEPVVSYTYTYEGQEYTSKSVYPGPEKRFKFKEDAKEITNQYSSGQTVTVYVNQKNPTRAFLIKETGGNLLPYFLIGIGALIALAFGSGVVKEFIGGGSSG